MTIAAIAGVLGVHPNTVRFHLDRLVGDGRVERVAPGRRVPGRPPLLFRAVRRMDRGGSRRYQLLAEILVAAVGATKDPRATAVAAGRAWGRTLDPHPKAATSPDRAIGRLVEVLDSSALPPSGGLTTASNRWGCAIARFSNWPNTAAASSVPSTSG